jgi:hypothetical protein
MVGGECLEDRRGGAEQDLGINTVEFGSELELLADRGLADADFL